MAEYIKSDRSTTSFGGIRLIRQIWSNFSERSNWWEIAPCRGRFTVQKLQRERPGLVNKFQRAANVCDEKRSARSSTSQETVETIWRATEQSPKASSRWQTLRFVLKKKVYHILVLGLTQQRMYSPYYYYYYYYYFFFFFEATLRTLCIITSTRRSQDSELDEAHHDSGQHARVI